MKTKTTLTLLILSLFLIFATPSHAAQKKVLMMVSNGFYAPEYFHPRAEFDKAGFKVTVASQYGGQVRPDRRQWKSHSDVTADKKFSEIDPANYDAIVFAGGNSAWEDFFPNQDVHKLLTHFVKSDKKIAALLCSSTGLLGIANNLDGDGTPFAKGRHVTGYKRVKGILTKMGEVNYDGGVEGKPYVVVDKNLVTGRDPSSSQLFGETITKLLKK